MLGAVPLCAARRGRQGCRERTGRLRQQHGGREKDGTGLSWAGTGAETGTAGVCGEECDVYIRPATSAFQADPSPVSLRSPLPRAARCPATGAARHCTYLGAVSSVVQESKQPPVPLTRASEIVRPTGAPPRREAGRSRRPCWLLTSGG